MEKGLNHEKSLDKALRAAAAGREVLNQYFGRLSHIQEKHLAGLVSEADKASEDTIKKILLEDSGEYGFLGEEEAFANPLSQSQLELDRGLWVVDPLDGTTNYIHRFPIFCISIALVIKSKPVVAVIDAPALNETFFAVAGKGAYRNQVKMKVSETRDLAKSLSATGFYAGDKHSLDEQYNLFKSILEGSRGVRRPGAAAYDLAMVANGVFDFFWETSLKPWDTAAGVLLINEAGGQVSTYRNAPYKLVQHSLLASNGSLHHQIINKFREHLKPETD